MDTTHAKNALLSEKEALEKELSDIAEPNPQNPGDWDAKNPDLDIMEADQNEASDRIEERFANLAEQTVLERRYRDVARALEKIESGIYGVCEVSGEPIEADRLAANPAARTCKAHMDEEERLPQ